MNIIGIDIENLCNKKINNEENRNHPMSHTLKIASILEYTWNKLLNIFLSFSLILYLPSSLFLTLYYKHNECPLTYIIPDFMFSL